TYTSGAFTADDYFQFNADSTAKQSASGEYTINGKMYIADTFAASIMSSSYNYHLTDNNLSLSTTGFVHPTNGSSIFSCVVETLNKTELVIRTTYHNGNPHGSPAYD